MLNFIEKHQKIFILLILLGIIYILSFQVEPTFTIQYFDTTDSTLQTEVYHDLNTFKQRHDTLKQQQPSTELFITID